MRLIEASRLPDWIFKPPLACTWRKRFAMFCAYMALACSAMRAGKLAKPKPAEMPRCAMRWDAEMRLSPKKWCLLKRVILTPNGRSSENTQQKTNSEKIFSRLKRVLHLMVIFCFPLVGHNPKDPNQGFNTLIQVRQSTNHVHSKGMNHLNQIIKFQGIPSLKHPETKQQKRLKMGGPFLRAFCC